MLDTLDSMLSSMEDYYWRMAGRGRLVSLTAGTTLLGLCTFFVLKDMEELPRFYPRAMWSMPEDAEDGAVVYLDKLVTYRWNLGIARQIESEISRRVPSWQTAVWYRPTDEDDPTYHGNDKQFIHRRR